jgi:hypothetical protein
VVVRSGAWNYITRGAVDKVAESVLPWGPRRGCSGLDPVSACGALCRGHSHLVRLSELGWIRVMIGAHHGGA